MVISTNRRRAYDKGELSHGCYSQHTVYQHHRNIENGQIPSTAPVRGIQYLSIVFGVSGEPHELCVEIGGERDVQVYIMAIGSWIH